jgi:hypothetical protein
VWWAECDWREGSSRRDDPSWALALTRAARGLRAGRGAGSTAKAPAREVAMIVDSTAAGQFLRTAFEPEDWIAIFLKSYETGRTAQRVGPVTQFLEPRVHAWLRAMNAQRFNVYVSVNAIRPGVRARTKTSIGANRLLRSPVGLVTDQSLKPRGLRLLSPAVQPAR